MRPWRWRFGRSRWCGCGRFGIRVATVVPGGFTTSMVANLIPTERDDSIYPRFRKTLEEYKRTASMSADFYVKLHRETRYPSQTLDGYEIGVAANIELPD